MTIYFDQIISFDKPVVHKVIKEVWRVSCGKAGIHIWCRLPGKDDAQMFIAYASGNDNVRIVNDDKE